MGSRRGGVRLETAPRWLKLSRLGRPGPRRGGPSGGNQNRPLPGRAGLGAERAPSPSLGPVISPGPVTPLSPVISSRPCHPPRPHHSPQALSPSPGPVTLPQALSPLRQCHLLRLCHLWALPPPRPCNHTPTQVVGALPPRLVLSPLQALSPPGPKAAGSCCHPSSVLGQSCLGPNCRRASAVCITRKRTPLFPVTGDRLSPPCPPGGPCCAISSRRCPRAPGWREEPQET